MDVVTGRRPIGGALFVVGGLIVAAIVVWPSGGSSTPGEAKPPAKIQQLWVQSRSRSSGLAFAHPRAWTASVSSRVIRLRSPDGSGVLTFTSPTVGHHTQRVRSETQRELLNRFAPAKIVRQGPAKLGTQPATSFELTGFRPDNDNVRVLVLVASTLDRTYTVTLVTPLKPFRQAPCRGAADPRHRPSYTKPVAVPARSPS